MLQSLEDPEERIGADIVMKALRAPCRAIAGMPGCWLATNQNPVGANMSKTAPKVVGITACTWLQRPALQFVLQFTLPLL